MNYSHKIFFILLLVSSIIFSKDSDGNIYKKDYKLSIHTSIIRPFDAHNPAMQAGFDFYFTDKISFQFDGGIIIPSSIEEALFTNEPSKHKGYRIETQLKYWIFYINTLPISHCFSLSLHPFYINNYYSKTSGWRPYDSTKIVYTDSEPGFFPRYDVKKITKGINLLFGYQLKFKRMGIRPFVGIGIRRRIIKNFNRLFEDETDIFGTSKESDNIGLNAHFDMTIGFLL